MMGYLRSFKELIQRRESPDFPGPFILQGKKTWAVFIYFHGVCY
jgi:hypothetical protein